MSARRTFAVVALPVGTTVTINQAAVAHAAAADGFLSEHIEGSSNSKALEVDQATGATVDLAKTVLFRFVN